MAYRDFKMDDLEQKFGVKEIGTQIFNPSKIKKIEPSDKLKADLAEARYITLSTEKAVSERLVAPVLVEIKKLNDDFLQIFSGEIINADSKLGLNGEIDFVFSKTPITLKPKNPLLTITESKLGLIDGAIGQAVAQMLGLRVFNQKRNHAINTVYGSVTDGNTWRFLKLEDQNLYIDETKYNLDNLPTILGILQEIVDFYKNTEGGKTTANN
jgi:hypothetical protein